MENPGVDFSVHPWKLFKTPIIFLYLLVKYRVHFRSKIISNLPMSKSTLIRTSSFLFLWQSFEKKTANRFLPSPTSLTDQSRDGYFWNEWNPQMANVCGIVGSPVLAGQTGERAEIGCLWCRSRGLRYPRHTGWVTPRQDQLIPHEGWTEKPNHCNSTSNSTPK